MKKKFIEFCKKNKFEQNINQIEIISDLVKFFFPKKRFSLISSLKKIQNHVTTYMEMLGLVKQCC